MRELTELELERIKYFTENAIEMTFIEPTANGLSKSIMDATAIIRDYLKSKGVHSYETQEKGENDKKIIKANLVKSDATINSEASLYRPKTKNGDPRIWLTNLRAYTNPSDILGIIWFENELHVINITQLDIKALLNSATSNPLKALVGRLANEINKIADELLALIKEKTKEPIRSLLKADTSIGRTLEAAIGIDINSSKNPDYKGIEIKSYRAEKKTRKTLFAQVPDWTLSRCKSSAEILTNFGYTKNQNFQLNCTVTTRVRNSQGLILRLDVEAGLLIENHEKYGDFAVWSLEKLLNRLLEKHNETFWVSAKTLIIEGEEYFKYTKIRHTRRPILSQFIVLLEQGDITLDHLIKKNEAGRISERGPLFKLHEKTLDLLFPPSKMYDLL